MAYELDPTLDFDAQEQALLQQAARIKALRSRDLSVTPTQPDSYTSAVTGAKMLAPMVKRPMLSALTPLIQDETAAREEAQLNEQRSVLSARDKAAYAKLLTDQPQPTTETVQQPLPLTEPKGTFVGTHEQILKDINGIPDDAGRSEALRAYQNQLDYPGHVLTRTITKQPTRAEMMAPTAEALKTGGPLTRALAAKLAEYQLTKQPELEEARAAREQEKALARRQAYEKQQEDLSFKRWQTEQQIAGHQATAQIMAGSKTPPKDTLTSGGFNAKGQAILYKNGDVTNPIIGAGVKQDPQGTGTYLGPDPARPGVGRWYNATSKEEYDGPVMDRKVLDPPKDLPGPQRNAWLSNNSSLRQFDEVRKLLRTPEGKGATGLWQGIVASTPVIGSYALNNWFDSKGTVTRAMVADIGSTIIHDRAGKAQTVAEMKVLAPFLPKVGDSRQEADRKMEYLQNKINEQQLDIQDFAAESNFRVPTAGFDSPRDTTPAPPPKRTVVPPTTTSAAPPAPQPAAAGGPIPAAIAAVTVQFPPAQYAGRKVKDPASGITLQSDGTTWSAVP